MSKLPQIPDSPSLSRPALVLCLAAALAGCGQRGPLFLPTGEAAAGRATLPQTLNPAASPASPASPASAPPTTGTANPTPRP